MELKLEKNLEKCEATFAVVVEGDEWKQACQKASEELLPRSRKLRGVRHSG